MSASRQSKPTAKCCRCRLGDDNAANLSTHSSKNRVVFISTLALLRFASKCISVLVDFKPFGIRRCLSMYTVKNNNADYNAKFPM